MSTKSFSTGGLHIVLRHVAFGAEISARRNRSQKLPIAINEVRDADHRRL